MIRWASNDAYRAWLGNAVLREAIGSGRLAELMAKPMQKIELKSLPAVLGQPASTQIETYRLDSFRLSDSGLGVSISRSSPRVKRRYWKEAMSYG